MLLLPPPIQVEPEFFRSGACRITAPPCKDGYELCASDMNHPIWIIRYGLSDICEMKRGLIKDGATVFGENM